MKILFDNGTPKPIAGSLPGHEISYARQIGWHELENGDLIRQAEEAGCDVLLSSDKNIRYQQNLADRRIAIVIPGNQQWPMVKRHLDKIAAAVNAATPGRVPNSFGGLVVLSVLRGVRYRFLTGAAQKPVVDSTDFRRRRGIRVSSTRR